MKHNFKVDDKVRCINADGAPLKLNKEYVVTRVYKCYIYFDTFFGGWNPERFELVRAKYPNPKHKHHDLIIEWAKGAEIEFLNTNQDWMATSESPTWYSESEYRIKPEKTERDIQMEKIQEKIKELKTEFDVLAAQD